MGRNFGFFPFLIRMFWIYFISIGWLLTLLILVPALIKKKKYDEAYLKELQVLEEERTLHLQKLTEETLDYEKQKINLQSYVDNLNTDISQKHERLVEMRGEETALRNTLATLAETVGPRSRPIAVAPTNMMSGLYSLITDARACAYGSVL